jgi:hypothetical protein
MTAAAPSGVVTFLFTDIEGSTRRWEACLDGVYRLAEAKLAALRDGHETRFLRLITASEHPHG